MPWLLDGNNLAQGGDREAVRRAALAVARHERVRILVIFDGVPPAGVAASEKLGGVEVSYARNADAAILALLGRAGRGWRVATDDRELGLRARAAGAEVVTAGTFWRKARSVEQASGGQRNPVSDLTKEFEYFGDSTGRLPAAPARTRRRPATARRRKR